MPPLLPLLLHHHRLRRPSGSPSPPSNNTVPHVPQPTQLIPPPPPSSSTPPPPPTYHFANFTDTETYHSLLTSFRSCGKVIDIHIPKARNGRGNRYGFVKFAGFSDSVSLLKNLRTLFPNNPKFFIDFAHSTPKKSAPMKTPQNHPSAHLNNAPKSIPKPNHSNHTTHSSIHPNKTYKDATTHPTHIPQAVPPGPPPLVKLRSDPFMVAMLETCAVIDVTMGEVLNRLPTILMDEPIGINSVTPIDGHKLLLSFGSTWTPLVHSLPRATWIQISGLPIHAWNDDNINTIASLIGPVIHIQGRFSKIIDFRSASVLVSWSFMMTTLTIQCLPNPRATIPILHHSKLSLHLRPNHYHP